MSLFDTITFPYRATSAAYSPSQPHRGNDYAADEGTPIIVAGTQIGLVGQTGWATGPHVHVQAGRDEWAQSTINPGPYTNQTGTVVKVGEASQWGKYVCIKVGDVYVYYCHMSRQDVSVGTVIKGAVAPGGTLMTEQFINNGYILAFNRQASRDEIDYHMKNSTPQTFTDGLVSSPDRFKPEAAQAQIKSLQEQLAAAKSSNTGASNPADAADAARYRAIKEALK